MIVPDIGKVIYCFIKLIVIMIIVMIDQLRQCNQINTLFYVWIFKQVSDAHDSILLYIL